MAVFAQRKEALSQLSLYDHFEVSGQMYSPVVGFKPFVFLHHAAKIHYFYSTPCYFDLPTTRLMQYIISLQRSKKLSKLW